MDLSASNLDVSEKLNHLSAEPLPTPRHEIMSKFGWGRFRPRCLKFLADPKCFLVVIMLYTLGTGR